MWKWIFLCLACTASLHAEKNVLAFAGSAREGSMNKKLIIEAAQIAKKMGANVTVVDLKDYPLPIFDEDLEEKEGMPEKAKELRKLMIQSEVIMIASPEYNASLTGLLKNTIDWTSRTDQGDSSRDAYKGKKFAIMSTSPGKGGGARGLVHLRAIIDAIGGQGTVIADQVIVPNAYEAFDADGHLKDPKTQAQLQQLVQKALQ